MSYAEMFSRLMDKCENKVHPVVGELGCNVGASTLVLAELVRKVNGTLVVIDWFKGSEAGGKVVIPAGKKKEFLLATQECDFIFFPVESGEAARIIKDGTFDLFWIDADHRYHAVKRDIELWLPKVKPGGVLSGHDYDRPEYSEEYIELDYVDGVHHGVTKAVNETLRDPQVILGSWWVQVYGALYWELG